MKATYKAVRSIIMVLIMLLVVVYVGLYVSLSVPSVQDRIKKKVCDESSRLLGGKVAMKSLYVYPFSEIMLTGVTLDSPSGERCASIGKVAAGIDLWRLLSDRKIVLNYAEIIGLDVMVYQDSAGSPTSIQFLVDALSPKDKKKPPTVFDLKIRNVVIRDSKASYQRRWLRDDSGIPLPYAEMNMDRIRMDLSIPVLNNDSSRFIIRNMQFDVTPHVNVRSLSADIQYIKERYPNGDGLFVKNFNISFPNSYLAVGDFSLNTGNFNDIVAKVSGSVCPSDFSGILKPLEVFDTTWDLDIDAVYKENGIEISD
ncbi:MAG: hypothetical protein K2H49_01505, partial [Muribaculaceae bacterium]|nr:hypothetical protein [Muribaculaceae bacterium]